MWAGPSLSPCRCFDMDNGLMPDSFSLNLKQLTAMKRCPLSRLLKDTWLQPFAPRLFSGLLRAVKQRCTSYDYNGTTQTEEYYSLWMLNTALSGKAIISEMLLWQLTALWRHHRSTKVSSSCSLQQTAGERSIRISQRSSASMSESHLSPPTSRLSQLPHTVYPIESSEMKVNEVIKARRKTDGVLMLLQFRNIPGHWKPLYNALYNY